MHLFDYLSVPLVLGPCVLAGCSGDPESVSPATASGPTSSGSETLSASTTSGQSTTSTTAATGVGGNSTGTSSSAASSVGGGTTSSVSSSSSTSATGAGGSSVTGTGGAGGVTSSTTGEVIETLEDGSPLLLSQTGLYLADMVTLAEGVRPFEPRFMLWSDGATKRRWIWLPEDAQIDTSEMDYWQFPVGTRVFKEFSRDGVRIETRMLTKRERGGWQRVAYQWRDDQLEADALLEGATDASGTDHDIPSQEDCGTCHFRTPDKVLGFSAIQLAWDNPDPEAWTLTRLEEAGKLTNPPPAIALPGSETAQVALGYMHANCGHCHNQQSSVTTRVTVSFWLSTALLGSVEETPTYTSSVCKDIELEEGGVPGVDKILDPGFPETSSVFRRVDTRGEEYAMPPLGTELVDTEGGRQAIEAWILSLDGVACE